MASPLNSYKATMDELTPDPAAPDQATTPLTVRGLATTIVVGASALYVLRQAAPFATLVLVAILLAYALEPFVDMFLRFSLSRPAAVLMTYMLAAVVLAGGARLARRQATAFLNELPATVAAIKQSMLRTDPRAAPRNRPGPIQNLQRAAADLQATVNQAAGPRAGGAARVVVEDPFDIRDYLLGAWTRVLATGAQLLIVAVLTFVLLLGGNQIKYKLVDIAGPRFDRQILTIDVIRLIDRQIQRYLVARVSISLIVAAATAAAMWWLGVRQPLVLGAIAGVLNVLPFVGPAIGVAVCAVFAFVQFHAIEPTLAAAGAATLVAALEGNLITPWLTGRAGELNTVAVYLSVLFWGWMWDVWGLLLAVPIMISVKAAADHIEPLQPLGELLGR
jgi:predicted PurR-regulated permease PerM